MLGGWSREFTLPPLPLPRKAMGCVPLAHDEECSCAECGDWERVFLDDFDAQAGLVRNLNEVE